MYTTSSRQQDLTQRGQAKASGSSEPCEGKWYTIELINKTCGAKFIIHSKFEIRRQLQSAAARIYIEIRRNA